MKRALRTALCLAVLALLVTYDGTAARPLQTAVWDPGTRLGVRRVADAGASVLHITVEWRNVAPVTRPTSFDPSDHLDPAYRWGELDLRVRAAVVNGLAPIVEIIRAPEWAEGDGPGGAGTVKPDPAELRAFAQAAATRYSGRFFSLPRVRYWQLWAEQNRYEHLNPQLDGRRVLSAIWYRSMLNAFAPAIHAVHPDNLVVTGGLAPFTTHLGENRWWGPGPLEFMREMLCMSKRLKPTCAAKSHFDVWAHHPYTSGGPNHHAYDPDDVSLGDLPEMRRLLDAAVRAGHVVSHYPIRFWVTEFSWDTSPPDPRGIPPKEHARWVSEALYRMWQSGVSLVTWLMLRDEPFVSSYFQSGLYYRGPTIKSDRPKRALQAFRFPFVALPAGRTVVVWGRTPTSRAGPVVLERRREDKWVRARTVHANRYGIFSGRLPGPAGGFMRARVGRDRSLPFAVRKTRDRFVSPFGTVPGWKPRRQ
jgi:hypothetical protein